MRKVGFWLLEMKMKFIFLFSDHLTVYFHELDTVNATEML